MSAPRGLSATKNQVIELVLAALGTSHAGLQALRGVLASDPRLAVLDGSVDLQPVWEVLEAQPDFSREAASAALCYVKALEARLGAQIKMPAALGDLSAGDRAQHASRCRPPREEVERILEGKDLRVAVSTPTVPLAVGVPRFSRRNVIGLVAALVAALSLIFVVYTIGSSLDQTPRFKSINAAEFAGDIPIGSARVWGTEVRAALVDPSWMRQPEERRRQQLQSAISRLAQRNLTTLILEDDSQRQRATAQTIGKTGKVQVRFYQ